MKLPTNGISKQVLLVFLILFTLNPFLKAQQFLTTVTGWNAYVHLPDDYASTTKNYPLIVFVPGLGEVGTNPSALLVNGPSRFIANGNKMQFMVNGVLEKPIVISVQPPATWPSALSLNKVLDDIISRWRVDINRISLTGLSMGGWAIDTYITDAKAAYRNRIASAMIMHAVTTNNPFSQFSVYASEGGRWWGIEGALDRRKMDQIFDAAETGAPGKNRYNLIPAGQSGSTHCCWNIFYDPNWTDNGESIYSWMLKQSRNTTTTPPPPPPVNVNPSANAGSDITITLPINSASLNGTGNDPDGTIVSYNWTKISGPASFSITNPTSASTTVSGLVQGIYKFELKVTDNNGATAIDEVSVTVNAPLPPPNVPPVANAGVDISITLPVSSVNLTGSGTDADGTISGYSWTKISGPAAGNIVSPSTSVTLVNNLVAGSYQFELKVSDNNGATAVDQVSVTVNPAPAVNIAPIANAGANQSITLPTNSITLNGTGTDTDGTVISYEWNKIAGPAALISNPSAASTLVSQLVQGSYSFEFKVIDDKGSIGKDTVTITVNGAPNQAPVAKAGADQVITLPVDLITLYGQGQDADGSIIAYNWKKIAGPTSYLIETPSNSITIISGLVQGNYQFELSVTDDQGSIGKDTVNVLVNGPVLPPVNSAPVADAGKDTSITLPDNSITLSGNGTDSDGSVTAYKWSKIAGPGSFSITNDSENTTTVTNLTEGIYKFELKITDDKGAVGFDTLVVTVNPAIMPPANMVPFVSAGADMAITLPQDSVQLNGSGSDTDGTVISFNWSIVSGPASIIDDATAPVTVVRNLLAGTYVFELKAIDDQGAIAKDTVIITVSAPAPVTNSAPVAYAGTDKSIALPASSITLSGSGTDSDGVISAYSWSKISGPVANILSPSNASTIVNGLVQGTYLFELKVIDDKGAYATDTVKITVTAVATPFYVNAGKDTTLPLSQMNEVTKLTVKGSTSATVLSWKWTQLSGTAADIAQPNAQTTEITGFKPGFYTFELNAFNGSYNALDTITVRVVDYQTKGESPCRTGAPKVWELTGTGTQIYKPYLRRDGYDIMGGDTIKIARNPSNGGVYSGISIGDFGGSKGCPVIVVPKDGIVAIGTSAGATSFFRIGNSNEDSNFVAHVVIDGTYLKDKGIKYGFQHIDNSPSAGSVGIIVNLATDLEIKGFATQGTGLGIMAKLQSDSTRPWRIYNNFRMKNLKIHDNYFSKIYGEVMYVGHSAPDGNQAGNNGHVVRLDSVWIYNNFIDSSGWDGPQVSNAVWTTMHDNIVMRTGQRNNYAQRASMIIGGNTTGSIHTNVIFNGKDGMLGTPYGNVEVYNNYIDSINAGGGNSDAIYLNGIETGSGTAIFESRDSLSMSIHANIINRVERRAIFLPDNHKITGFSHVYDNDVIDATRSISQMIVSGKKSDLLENNRLTASFPVKMRNIGSMATGPQIEVTQGNETHIFQEASQIIDWLRCRLNHCNLQPIVYAGLDTTIVLPVNSVTLRGSAIDPDGKIVSYKWRKVGGPGQYSLPQSDKPVTALNNLVSGVYKFELRATDSLGSYGLDTVVITVISDVVTTNNPPAVNAGADQTIILPVNFVIVNGTASDVDGSIINYSWKKISGPDAGTISSPETSGTYITDLTEGVYQFELTVTDNNGATATDRVTINVLAAVVPTNIPPVANAGQDKEISLPLNSVYQNGSGTDADGTIISYNWTKVSGPESFGISNPSAPATTFYNLVQGIYEFELKVTDDKGASARDTVRIQVNDNSISKATIYPNPAQDIITILIEAKSAKNQTSLLIYNAEGKVVYFEEFMRNDRIYSKKVDVSPLPKGVYVVVVTADINTKITTKLIKQ